MGLFFQVQTQHYAAAQNFLCPRINLYELMKNNSFQGFSLSIVRRFTLSVLKCLQMLYIEKIIHCDLKPVSTTSVPCRGAGPHPQEGFAPFLSPVVTGQGCRMEAKQHVCKLCKPSEMQRGLQGSPGARKRDAVPSRPTGPGRLRAWGRVETCVMQGGGSLLS